MFIYDFLFPIHSKYKSVVHIESKDIKGNYTRVCTIQPKNITDKLQQLKIQKDKNYYITANTFIPGRPRCNDNLYSLNNIVLDLDLHDDEIAQDIRMEMIEDFVWHLKRDLLQIDDAEYSLPAPNIIHYTGRGVQLWWHIEETSKSLLFLYKKIVKLLLLVINEYALEFPDLSKHKFVDESAAMNPVGLFRIVNTFNTASRTMSSYEMLHDHNYTLDEIQISLMKNEIVERYLTAIDSKKNLTQHRKSVPVAQRQADPRYASLNHKRLYIVERIIAQTVDHKGMRNNLLFVAYNCARYLYSIDEAKAYCLELNARMNPPKKNINSLLRQKTQYKLSEEKVRGYLGISEEEYEAYGNEYYAAHRNDARDAARKSKREEKDQIKCKAEELLVAGHKIAEVAAMSGLSVSVIKKISAKIEKPKRDTCPWEQAGLSRSTYYRHKKLEMQCFPS